MEPSMSQRERVRELLGYLAGGPALAARGLIQVYRHTVAALIGLNCRHLPTCSNYADEAVGRFGLWAGGWMTLARHQLRRRPCAAARLSFDRSKAIAVGAPCRTRGTSSATLHAGHIEKIDGRRVEKLGFAAVFLQRLKRLR
jgi:putative membrane protein insertion efficiency factor